MLPILQFIFSSFWVWLGTVILLSLPVLYADYAFQSLKIVALAYLGDGKKEVEKPKLGCGCQHCN